ncbi:MAG TPA: hypothetical protein VM164_05195 [Burkholderiales bacterium]|nr:hypothetical protein [Burkholderiales bacterium]
MILSVKDRGGFAATMRYVHVWLMETLAAWVPTTPEMEVKLLFGEHIWDVAQHADALGKRTFELRLPLQHSLRPADEYVSLLADLAGTQTTPERLAAVYDVMLPALAARTRRYIEATDALSDAPSVRVLERGLSDYERMLESARALRQELPALRSTRPEWADALRAREAAIEVVAKAPTVATAGA